MLRSSASEVLSAWVYMGRSPWRQDSTYNKKNIIQDNFVTYFLVLKPPPKLLPRGRQRARFVRTIVVEPSLGWLEQPLKNLAAQPAGRPARPIPGQQRGRQQRISQHHPAVVMDQQDARGEGVGV